MKQVGLALLLLVLLGCGGGEATNVCTGDGGCPQGSVCLDGQCLPAARGDSDPNPTDGDPTDNDPSDSDPSDSDTPTDDDTPGDVDLGDSVPDTTGPVITILSPTPLQMVSGIINISVEIEDPSEVNPDQVELVIANNPSLEFLSPFTNIAAGTWHATFDTRRLTFGALPQIRVLASDMAGNQSDASYAFAIDNTPPVLSMDATEVRYTRKVNDLKECSHRFNPLGNSAVKHGDVITPSSDFGLFFYPRVRIEDFGNAVGNPVIFSGIHHDSARLYVLTKLGIDEDIPLFEQSGGVCTGVSAQILATTERAFVASQNIVAATPAGAANFTPGGADGQCPSAGSDSDPPEDICTASAAEDLTIWTSYTEDEDPNIFVVTPYDPNSTLSCTGSPFDTSYLPDGPACLTAEAVDNVGNRAVARAIAICIDKDGTGDECDAFDANAVRDACQAGCTTAAFAQLTAYEL